jgi:hypothetical protein
VKLRLLLLACLTALSLEAAGEPVLSAPIKRFRLPTFNQAGYQTSLLEGDQAVLVSTQQIDVKEMHFTVLSGTEEKLVQTTLLAPDATLRLHEENRFTVSGAGAVRLVRNDIDAAGQDWSFEFQEHGPKRLMMKKNVRVVFRAVLKDILK